MGAQRAAPLRCLAEVRGVASATQEHPSALEDLPPPAVAASPGAGAILTLSPSRLDSHPSKLWGPGQGPPALVKAVKRSAKPEPWGARPPRPDASSSRGGGSREAAPGPVLLLPLQLPVILRTTQSPTLLGEQLPLSPASLELRSHPPETLLDGGRPVRSQGRLQPWMRGWEGLLSSKPAPWPARGCTVPPPSGNWGSCSDCRGSKCCCREGGCRGSGGGCREGPGVRRQGLLLSQAA